jgi:hypothetical protein
VSSAPGIVQHAKMSRADPNAGSTYTYPERAFGGESGLSRLGDDARLFSCFSAERRLFRSYGGASYSSDSPILSELSLLLSSNAKFAGFAWLRLRTIYLSSLTRRFHIARQTSISKVHRNHRRTRRWAANMLLNASVAAPSNGASSPDVDGRKTSVLRVTVCTLSGN